MFPCTLQHNLFKTLGFGLFSNTFSKTLFSAQVEKVLTHLTLTKVWRKDQVSIRFYCFLIDLNTTEIKNWLGVSWRFSWQKRVFCACWARLISLSDQILPERSGIKKILVCFLTYFNTFYEKNVVWGWFQILFPKPYFQCELSKVWHIWFWRNCAGNIGYQANFSVSLYISTKSI